jgi:uncharacterized membrane protein YozB (DUF420 family)
LNASLNALSAIFLVLGWILIRQRTVSFTATSDVGDTSHQGGIAQRRFVRAHVIIMLTALALSTVFLSSYLVYHSQAGSTPFPHSGAVRVVYFTILLSHTVLAVAVVPLVGLILARAVRRQYARHAALAQVTFPIWLYVATTGVVIYFMLYHLAGTLAPAPSVL